MKKLTMVICGGVPNELKDNIEEIIKEVHEQEYLFVTDIKTHSIEFMTVEEGPLDFIKTVIRQFNFVVISFNRFKGDIESEYIVLGGSTNSTVTSRMQEQAKGLFK